MEWPLGVYVILIGVVWWLIAKYLANNTSISPIGPMAAWMFCLCIGGFMLINWGIDRVFNQATEDVQCPVCHVYVDTPYCGSCGAQITGEGAVVLCPNCSAQCDTPYCEQCGTKLS